MAILIEGISVVVRRAAVGHAYPGGWEAFVEAAPGQAFCADDELACVGFEATDDAEAYCNDLAAAGLSFGDGGAAVDVAVVDQFEGMIIETDWLECARLDFDAAGHEIAVCWLYEGPHIPGEIHLDGDEIEVAIPEGWTYETSMSATARFIPEDEVAERLEFVRHDPRGVDVYRDRETGEELFAQCDHEESEPED